MLCGPMNKVPLERRGRGQSDTTMFGNVLEGLFDSLQQWRVNERWIGIIQGAKLYHFTSRIVHLARNLANATYDIKFVTRAFIGWKN